MPWEHKDVPAVSWTRARSVFRGNANRVILEIHIGSSFNVNRFAHIQPALRTHTVSLVHPPPLSFSVHNRTLQPPDFPLLCGENRRKLGG